MHIADMQIGAVLHGIALGTSIKERICIQCFVSLTDILLYHTCIMDEEGICSLERVLYIDCKAIFTNGGHYEKTSGCVFDKILSKLNFGRLIRTLEHFLYLYPTH